MALSCWFGVPCSSRHLLSLARTGMSPCQCCPSRVCRGVGIAWGVGGSVAHGRVRLLMLRCVGHRDLAAPCGSCAPDPLPASTPSGSLTVAAPLGFVAGCSRRSQRPRKGASRDASRPPQTRAPPARFSPPVQKFDERLVHLPAHVTLPARAWRSHRAARLEPRRRASPARDGWAGEPSCRRLPRAVEAGGGGARSPPPPPPPPPRPGPGPHPPWPAPPTQARPTRNGHARAGPARGAGVASSIRRRRAARQQRAARPEARPDAPIPTRHPTRGPGGRPVAPAHRAPGSYRRPHVGSVRLRSHRHPFAACTG